MDRGQFLLLISSEFSDDFLMISDETENEGFAKICLI